MELLPECGHPQVRFVCFFYHQITSALTKGGAHLWMSKLCCQSPEICITYAAIQWHSGTGSDGSRRLTGWRYRGSICHLPSQVWQSGWFNAKIVMCSTVALHQWISRRVHKLCMMAMQGRSTYGRRYGRSSTSVPLIWNPSLLGQPSWHGNAWATCVAMGDPCLRATSMTRQVRLKCTARPENMICKSCVPLRCRQATDILYNRYM